MATTEEMYLKNMTEEELSKKLEEELNNIEEYNDKIKQSETLVSLIEHEMARRAIQQLNEQGDDEVTLVDFSKDNQKKSK